jgi:hypothetical protein
LERLKEVRGLADILRVDNKPGLLGSVFAEWRETNGIFIDWIGPGQPKQPAPTEACETNRRAFFCS